MAKKKIIKKVARPVKVNKHLDPTVFMLLAFIVIILLSFCAMQLNLPLASFLMLK